MSDAYKWHYVEGTYELVTGASVGRHSFTGSTWQAAPGTYYVPAGSSEIEVSNDPATCWVGQYENNVAFKAEIVGLGTGRLGRLTSTGIMASDPPYSGSCSQDPGAFHVSSWLEDFLDELSALAEGLWTAIGNPIDSASPTGALADQDPGC